MGRIPPPIPPLWGSDAEKREQLTRHRDHLIRLQKSGPGIPKAVWIFLIFCWILTFWGLWKILSKTL